MRNIKDISTFTTGSVTAPTLVDEGGQLLLWPDRYDPKQDWDRTPFDAPERAHLYLRPSKGKGKAKGGCR